MEFSANLEASYGSFERCG